MDLEQCEKALQATGRVVAEVRAEQHDDPTPCADWNVRALVNHIIFGNWMFARAAGGERVNVDDEPPDMAGDDAVSAYRDSADAVLAAWRKPGAMEQICTLPFGDIPGEAAMGLHFTDVLVHGWDLARATGQEYDIDPDLAQTALEMVQATVDDEVRDMGVFGPEITVAEDASVSDRLVSFLGRQP